MYWQDNLTQSERDTILDSLDKEQQIFIKEYVKRGRKTVFANVLAKEKAGLETEGTIAEKWELVDYLDAGITWQSSSELYCDCGRRLRYQYIVQNVETGEIKKFGISHFEEHTAISPQLAREIVKGIEKIDYEMDELLLKLINDWSLGKEEGITEIPQDVEIPNDIKHHLDYDIPLLQRQVKRLKEIIISDMKEKERLRLSKLAEQKEKQLQQEQIENLEQKKNRTKSLQSVKLQDISLDRRLQAAILVYLEEAEKSMVRATDICHVLIENHGAPNETYSSGTPRIYSVVCMYLEYLVNEGILNFVGEQDQDRIYQLLDAS